MSTPKQTIRAVPTNIITGFLGVGKTTAILKILQQKPVAERWAVLVNEFGEIGVDGSLFLGAQASEGQGVFVKEVPGGCMCCASGVTMRVALNQLLKQARPDRLLIEPSGLGHPKEVLAVLAGEYYRQVLSLNKTITLVDARHLSDKRYTNHETFNQQLEMADVVIGNKQEMYLPEDKDKLIRYVKKKARPGIPVFFTQQGEINNTLVFGGERDKTSLTPSDEYPHLSFTNTIKTAQEGEGFNSVGWRFSANKVFDYARLYALLDNLKVMRMKAVFQTDAGLYAYNATLDGMTETSIEQLDESKIEIIADRAYEELEGQLLNCLISV